MANNPVFVTSDLHLGAVPAETERSFIRWLSHAGQESSGVVLNGDLFDFWFEYRSAIPRGYTRVLGALAELTDAGIEVILLGGNHDWWGGSYLSDELGVSFHQDPIVIELAGKKVFLAHGDGLGKGDLGYRLLRWTLRGRFTRWGFRWLHPDTGAWLARRVSQTKHRMGEPGEHERNRARFLEEWAIAKLNEMPELDLVLLGHTHIPVLREVEEGRYYLNSGDWLTHRSYAILRTGEPPELVEWER